MPTYEFTCDKCNKHFSVTMTIRERERHKTKCPKCNSTRVRQQFSSFVAKTSKKS